MTATFEWIDTDGGFADVCKAAADADFYALDTEFHRERTYYPHVALLQLKWHETTVLVDTLAVEMAPLADLLTSDALPLLHAADQDLEVFRRACGALPSRMFDTQIVANFAGFSTPSLAALVERIVG
ncbi:MAG: ribonuclease D, partial [Actinobacteria bacterium]|nr:ribonuclease D [Actinomycetota bacterium]